MSKHNPETIIREVTEALRGSIPGDHHNQVLSALKRCQEMIDKLSATVLELDKKQQHGELMMEAKLYANVLAGFFGDDGRDWFDLTKGYNPRDYLTGKGIIKPVNPTRLGMEAKWEADRKAQQAEIDRLMAEYDRKRNARKVNATTMALIKAGAPKHLLDDAFIQPLVEPPKRSRKPKVGRPIGSKNKPKGIVSRVNAIMEAKKKRGGK